MKKRFLIVTLTTLALFTGCIHSVNNSPTNTLTTSTPTNDVTSSNDSSTENTTSQAKETPKKKKLTKREKYQRYAKQIKVKVYNKKNLPANYNAGRFSEFIEIDCKVINKSPKGIRGIKGTLSIYNQFDDLVLDLNWDSSKKVEPGKTVKITNHGLDYNPFLDYHQELHDLKYEDLVFKFEPEQINFSDGYKLKF